MKIKIKILRIFLAVCIFHTAFVHAQNNNFNNILKAFNNEDYEQVKSELHKIDTLKINQYNRAIWLYYFAEYHFNIDNHDIAFNSIIKAKNKFKKLDKYKDFIDCNMLLLSILSHQNNLKVDTKTIINGLTQYAKEKKDTLVLKKLYHRLASKLIDINNKQQAIFYFNKIIIIAKKQKDTLRIGQYYSNIGVAHKSTNDVDLDSSLYYYKKSESFLKKQKAIYDLVCNYNNQGEVYFAKKEYKKAIKYYIKSDSIQLKKHIPKTKVVIYENIAKCYDSIQDYKNATLFLNKLIKLKDSINDTHQNTTIAGIKEKYDNEKLRADKLYDRNLLNMISLLLLFGVITSILVYYNIKRKQKIIQNEKFIEQQKVSNLLKEQELIAIDAMLVGQEKERQLIASDLHDDLGALMTTLQYNFENLYNHRESEESESLFKQTKTLIKEAYQKIRLIAQAKNSGVIAKQGLLKAIKNNAHKIAKLNKIQIEIKEHGLENRLQNTLEITIFRIIQELLTNIIKHAKATQVTIHIINHKESLNIMVEDNGVGFNIENIAKKEGMGIKSIEKRVEFLEGTITIESIIENGTTIIIDIPI